MPLTTFWPTALEDFRCQSVDRCCLGCKEYARSVGTYVDKQRGGTSQRVASVPAEATTQEEVDASHSFPGFPTAAAVWNLAVTQMGHVLIELNTYKISQAFDIITWSTGSAAEFSQRRSHGLQTIASPAWLVLLAILEEFHTNIR